MKDSREEINQEIKKIQDKFIAEFEIQHSNVEEIKDNNYSFCPENNDGNYTLSNLNRTLERTSGGNSPWRGFRCENPLLNLSDKLIFSIKIEKTERGNMLIGFCLKTTNNSAGYFQTNSSFMLHLNGGYFYNKPNPAQLYNSSNTTIKCQVNHIYTAILDKKQKSVEFLLNGESLGAARTINIKNEEILQLCPCVDLAFDKVSLIKPVL